MTAYQPASARKVPVVGSGELITGHLIHQMRLLSKDAAVIGSPPMIGPSFGASGENNPTRALVGLPIIREHT